ncbi:acyl-CoA:6-aminopenicillanic acid acyl transferase [Paraburkholderia sp. RAU2J]|nr:acyl-CoA:6-aminopenicillanic acid acyl transferase [Paraburkholderia sp. RAU2J]
MASRQGVGLFQVSGGPYDIGYRLGEIARPVFAEYMAQSRAWHAVRRWRGEPFVQTPRDAARSHYPALLAELDGMAAALGWPAEDVFLWNCRGELIHYAPDGCTTLAAVAGDQRFIAHNEDGAPFLRECCALVEVRPVGKPGLVSFCYPGSLPGHTFAASRAGIAQAINNLRIREPAAGVPRMILARVVRDAGSLDEALHLLRTVPAASGFHHTLGCAGDARLFSAEASARRCSVRSVSGLADHANHMIHPGCEAEAQIVTESSRNRQLRVDACCRRSSRQCNPLRCSTYCTIARHRACRSIATTRSIPTTKTRLPPRSSKSVTPVCR